MREVIAAVLATSWGPRRVAAHDTDRGHSRCRPIHHSIARFTDRDRIGLLQRGCCRTGCRRTVAPWVGSRCCSRSWIRACNCWRKLAAFFAGIHVFTAGPAGVVNALLLGSLLTWLRLRYNNLAGAWLLHLVNNLLEFLIAPSLLLSLYVL